VFADAQALGLTAQACALCPLSRISTLTLTVPHRKAWLPYKETPPSSADWRLLRARGLPSLPGLIQCNPQIVRCLGAAAMGIGDPADPLRLTETQPASPKVGPHSHHPGPNTSSDTKPSPARRWRG